MKRSLILIGMELKYLLRQKFLWILVLVGIALSVFQAPRSRIDLDYSIYADYNKNHSTEGMSERDQFGIAYWQEKQERIKENRNRLYERALAEKQALTEQSGFRWEYVTAVEKAYSQEINLEIQEYTGWEWFFLVKSDMSPHNTGLFLIILVAAAGLLLMTKDKENHTLFWSSFTGRGAGFSSYLLKIAAVLLYGLCVHIFFTGLYILLLACMGGLDMHHWINAIQNLDQYGLCDLHLNILGTCVLDMVLKCMASILVMFIVLLLTCVIRRYIFLFLAGLCVNGIFYYFLCGTVERRSYSISYRMNPFSILKLDKVLTYDAVNIFNHAVDVRLLFLVLWACILFGLLLLTYRVWRRFLYANES